MGKCQLSVYVDVSIHAPQEGCDSVPEEGSDAVTRFQFTHPRRGATVLIMDDIYKDAVSIHAPQEGCD